MQETEDTNHESIDAHPSSLIQRVNSSLPVSTQETLVALPNTGRLAGLDGNLTGSEGPILSVSPEQTQNSFFVAKNFSLFCSISRL